MSGAVAPVGLAGGRLEPGEPLLLGAQPGRPAFVDGGGVALVPRSLTLEDPPGRDRRLAVVQVVDGALVDTGEHVATLEAPWLVVVQP